jgi:hypothetical protein
MLLSLFATFILSASARTLSYNDCIELVSQNNPELLAARSNYESSNQLVKSTYSNFLPTVNASLGASNNSPATYGANPLYSSALTASYNLFSGLKDQARIKQAEANRKIARANLDSVRAKLGFTLRKAFAQYQYARENISLTELIRDRRFQNDRLVRAQYESGRENQGSYLVSKSLYDQSIFDQRVAKDQSIIAIQQLAHVLGEDENDLEIKGEIPQSIPPENSKAEALFLTTPAHRLQMAQVELSESNSKVAISAFFPSLDLAGSVTQKDNHFFPETNHQWSLGLTLTIPLFSGFKSYRDYQSTRSLEYAARSNLIAADFDLISELRQNLFTYQESIEKLKVDLSSLNAATIRAKIARMRYNSGLLAFEQWDIIETDLISRQKAALASKRDRIIAESAYLQSQGLGDIP